MHLHGCPVKSSRVKAYETLKQALRKWTFGLFITLVPKVLQYRFLFVGITTLGTLLNFDLSVH